MKAEELMIGNRILFLGKEVIVERIENLDTRQEMYWIKPKGLISSKIIHFSGIELSSKILIDFGFKYNEFNDSFELNGFFIYQCDNLIWYDTVTDCLNIKHVHQLQNIYFSIIGDQLTLKNKL